MEKLARKDFIKGAIVVGGAVAAGGLTGVTTADAKGKDNNGIAGTIDELVAAVRDLKDRLWVAEAKEAIRYKLCLYCRGDDRQDAEEGKKAFAKDSYVDYGTSPDRDVIFKGSGWDWVDTCVAGDKSLSDGGIFYAHVMSNIAITVNGNKAGSETYVNAPVVIPNGDGTYTCMQSVARYCDKWECRDDDWVIVERITTNDYGWYTPSTGIYTPYGGSFDKKDPSYAALAYGAKKPSRR